MATWKHLTIMSDSPKNSTLVNSRLRSSQLDAVLHRDRTATIRIGGDLDLQRKGVVVALEPFHIASIEAYVEQQSLVRSTVVGALNRVFPEAASAKGDEGVWQGVQEMWVEVLSEEAVCSIYSDRQSRARFKKDPLRSFFNVVLKSKWDEDQRWRFSFVNGTYDDAVSR